MSNLGDKKPVVFLRGGGLFYLHNGSAWIGSHSNAKINRCVYALKSRLCIKDPL